MYSMYSFLRYQFQLYGGFLAILVHNPYINLDFETKTNSSRNSVK